MFYQFDSNQCMVYMTLREVNRYDDEVQARHKSKAASSEPGIIGRVWATLWQALHSTHHTEAQAASAR
jgi:hypothetical protein